MFGMLASFDPGEPVVGKLAAPIDQPKKSGQQGLRINAAGKPRREECNTGDLYDHVYDAPRPELFLNHWGGGLWGVEILSEYVLTAVGMCPNRNWSW